MSVHTLRIHARAEALTDRLSVIVDLWSPIHRDGLGRTLVDTTENIAQHIKMSYDARLTDEKLHRLALADERIQEAKHSVYRAINRALLDEHEGVMLTRSLRSLSISTIEFANAILERDPEYRGQWRGWVERRRAWKLREEREAELLLQQAEAECLDVTDTTDEEVAELEPGDDKYLVLDDDEPADGEDQQTSDEAEARDV